MGLKITFVFAMTHYAGNDLKREPSLQRACDLEANAPFPAERYSGCFEGFLSRALRMRHRALMSESRHQRKTARQGG
jgi:hypothetical protein